MSHAAHMTQSNVTPNRKRTHEELCREYEELQLFIVVMKTCFIVVMKSSAHMKSCVARIKGSCRT